MKNISFTNENKSISTEVELENSNAYQFVLSGYALRLPEGVRLKDYTVDFKTGE